MLNKFFDNTDRNRLMENTGEIGHRGSKRTDADRALELAKRAGKQAAREAVSTAATDIPMDARYEWWRESMTDSESAKDASGASEAEMQSAFESGYQEQLHRQEARHVHTTEKKPRMQRPSGGHESPHPYQGRMVGESDEDFDINSLIPEIRRAAAQHALAGKKLSSPAQSFQKKWSMLDDAGAEWAADIYQQAHAQAKSDSASDDHDAWREKTAAKRQGRHYHESADADRFPKKKVFKHDGITFYKRYAEQEYADLIDKITDPADRKQFIKLMQAVFDAEDIIDNPRKLKSLRKNTARERSIDMKKAKRIANRYVPGSWPEESAVNESVELDEVIGKRGKPDPFASKEENDFAYAFAVDDLDTMKTLYKNGLNYTFKVHNTLYRPKAVINQVAKTLKKNESDAQKASLYHPDSKTYRGSRNKMPHLDDGDPVNTAGGLDTMYDYEAEYDPISSTEQGMDQKRLQKHLNKAMQGLRDQEKEVLNLRFGLDGSEPLTLEQVSKVIGVSRERVRQIEAKALRKLRHPTRTADVASYMESMGMVESRSTNIIGLIGSKGIGSLPQVEKIIDIRGQRDGMSALIRTTDGNAYEVQIRQAADTQHPELQRFTESAGEFDMESLPWKSAGRFDSIDRDKLDNLISGLGGPGHSHTIQDNLWSEVVKYPDSKDPVQDQIEDAFRAHAPDLLSKPSQWHQARVNGERFLFVMDRNYHPAYIFRLTDRMSEGTGERVEPTELTPMQQFHLVNDHLGFRVYSGVKIFRNNPEAITKFTSKFTDQEVQAAIQRMFQMHGKEPATMEAQSDLGAKDSKNFRPVNFREKLVKQMTFKGVPVIITHDHQEDFPYQLYIDGMHHDEFDSVDSAVDEAKYEIKKMMESAELDKKTDLSKRVVKKYNVGPKDKIAKVYKGGPSKNVTVRIIKKHLGDYEAFMGGGPWYQDTYKTLDAAVQGVEKYLSSLDEAKFNATVPVPMTPDEKQIAGNSGVKKLQYNLDRSQTYYRFDKNTTSMPFTSKQDLDKLKKLVAKITKESVELEESFTDKEIKMAYGILNDPRYKAGNLTKAIDKIEKIKKGLSKHSSVQKAMKATSEAVELEESVLVKVLATLGGMTPQDVAKAFFQGTDQEAKKRGMEKNPVYLQFVDQAKKEFAKARTVGQAIDVTKRLKPPGEGIYDRLRAGAQLKAEPYKFKVSGPYKDEMDESVNDGNTNLPEGTLRTAATGLALAAALWGGAELTSAKHTPLGKALHQAAQAGDQEAAQHLKKLDLYTEAGDLRTLEQLRDKYMQ